MSNISIKIHKRIFNKAFLPLLHDKNRYEIIYGGAGSGKSYFIAQKLILLHLLNAERNTLVIRKVHRTHKYSTFAQIRSTIHKWGLTNLFKINKSDMTITRVGGGQIIFAGLDDPEKLKSITFERGILTNIWIEEASEITETDFEQLDLRLRGKTKVAFQIILSFNPISALSWLKKAFFDRQRDDVTILKTTYKDNRFIDDQYKQKLEALKDTNPILYKIYALGEWGVLGNLVFTNYEIKEFDDEEFWRYYNGLDWGFNDPAAGIKIGFKDDTIYIIDEFYVTGKDNPELMQVAERIWQKDTDKIIADNAEPKSIREWRKEGWRIAPCKKGKDSVKYGIGWIRSHRIVIHPRCQNFINEIQAYAYRQDKDGNVLEDPVDFKNHLMDAMRYALEPVMSERKVEFLI